MREKAASVVLKADMGFVCNVGEDKGVSESSD